VLDAGELPKNDPSTVIDTTLSTPITLRVGKIKTTSGESLTSKSENETKKIAGTLMLKHWNQIREKGLVIGLDGVLGAGKTIFTKGVAKFLQISETITSPTYSYIEEYGYQRYGINGKLYHIDLWKIENEAELKRLEVEKLMAPNNVIVIEWWDQGKKYLEKITDLKILIEEDRQKNRKITI
jgi:tRNA threonylcarbamoyladenosine biosynthesis protein TsaE